MALPEGLKLVNDPVERPFITLRNLYITFSKQAVKMLEFSPYVHMFVDDRKKIAAFQVSENDAAAIPFYRSEEHTSELQSR